MIEPESNDHVIIKEHDMINELIEWKHRQNFS